MHVLRDIHNANFTGSDNKVGIMATLSFQWTCVDDSGTCLGSMAIKYDPIPDIKSRSISLLFRVTSVLLYKTKQPSRMFPLNIFPWFLFHSSQVCSVWWETGVVFTKQKKTEAQQRRVGVNRIYCKGQSIKETKCIVWLYVNLTSLLQYIQRSTHTAYALLCFVVVNHKPI